MQFAHVRRGANLARQFLDQMADARANEVESTAGKVRASRVWGSNLRGEGDSRPAEVMKELLDVQVLCPSEDVKSSDQRLHDLEVVDGVVVVRIDADGTLGNLALAITLPVCAGKSQ